MTLCTLGIRRRSVPFSPIASRSCLKLRSACLSASITQSLALQVVHPNPMHGHQLKKPNAVKVREQSFERAMHLSITTQLALFKPGLFFLFFFSFSEVGRIGWASINVLS